MKKLSLLYILFFFSGAAGLIYQIVWTRMLLLIFGTTTNSVVAVVSAFMAGLAMGSYLVPRLFKRWKNLLVLYAIIEIIIGTAAATTPWIFHQSTLLYTAVYHVTQNPYFLLWIKFFLISLVLLPSTIAMGATLPILVEYLNRISPQGDPVRIVRGLYTVNTLGALAGVLESAYFFIELFGLIGTLSIAIGINLLIGFIALVASRFKIYKEKQISDAFRTVREEINAYKYPNDRTKLILGIFAVSGMISMSYEILWIRMLTPVIGTFIYAFAFVLGLFLLGLALGSLLEGFVSKRLGTLTVLALIEFCIGCGAIVSVIAAGSLFTFSPLATQLFVLIPATIAMGMMFPAVSRLSRQHGSIGSFIGTSYAFNTIGSMAGPYAAAFILLPIFGTTRSILFLAVINLILASVLFAAEIKKVHHVFRNLFYGSSIFIILFIFITAGSGSQIFTERTIGSYLSKFKSGEYAYILKEDETASVLGYRKKDGSDAGLLVDGIGMSVMVDETKLMAHIPILTHPNPKNVLVIAFGMGTTFRSALSHAIEVDAVELVPSVPDTFGVFFSDAENIQANPLGNVIINDGRNYVRMTSKRYDVITIDPPPPVNSAGTTVLYSKEFYEDAKRILKDDGILSQWLFYGTRADDFQMLVKSMTDVFPYLVVFQSPRAIGIYVLGSDKPIEVDEVRMKKWLDQHGDAMKDLNEWGTWDAHTLSSLKLGDKDLLTRFVKNALSVTDMHPRTEYFRLRYANNPAWPIARNEVLLNPDSLP